MRNGNCWVTPVWKIKELLLRRKVYRMGRHLICISAYQTACMEQKITSCRRRVMMQTILCMMKKKVALIVTAELGVICVI
jgi:hypothetical protein